MCNGGKRVGTGAGASSPITHFVFFLDCYFGWFGDFLIDFSISRARGPYMYILRYVYAHALSDMRHITLVLMHILIQPPSS